MPAVRPNRSCTVCRSASSWHGWNPSVSAFTTGTVAAWARSTSRWSSNVRITMASTYRESTWAASDIDSPRPKWVLRASITSGWPPSWAIPTSNDTRVRSDSFSKITATARPSSGRASSGFRLRSAARSRTSACSAAVRSSSRRKCRITSGPPRKCGACGAFSWGGSWGGSRGAAALFDAGGAVERRGVHGAVEGGRQRGHEAVGLLGREDQRRRQPQHVRLHRVDQEPGLLQLGGHPYGDLGGEDDAEQQTGAAYLRDQAGCRSERHTRADRQPAAQALGQRDHVRLDPVGLVCVPLAGTADAGLHLVEHQQRALLGGDLPRRLQITRRRYDDPVLPLQRLQDHHGGIHGDLPGKRPDVPVRHVADIARQRLERLGLGRLAGERQGTHGPAVEPAVGGHHLSPPGTPGQLERRLVGLRAGVGEEHPARPIGESQQPLGELGGRRRRHQVGHVAQGRYLPGDRRHDGRVRVAERVDGYAAVQVEVAAPGLVGHHRALAAYQGQRGHRVRGHQRGRPPVPERHDGTTMVPNPSSVNTSSSSECATRPSITCACGTPPRTARRHASIFGIIPLARPDSMSSNWSAAISESRLSRSGQSAYRPSTSVSTTSFCACRATASAEAAVSALRLCTTPSASGATVEITGIRPAAIRSVTAAGLTRSTSPTSPMSTASPSTYAGRLTAVNSFASSPDIPTAYGPCSLIRPTSSRPTWPTRTIRTTSAASAVVTRRPPLNSLSMPSRASIAPICGPPPCTTTGLRPAYR